MIPESILSEKPTFPILTSIKFAVGILTLIFAGALVFVLKEERQRGIAVFLMIPFGVCLMYFSYLWFRDNKAAEIYLEYLKKLRAIIIKHDPDYMQHTVTDFEDFKTPINISGLLAILTLFGTVILQAESSKLTVSFAFIFIATLSSFIILNELEIKAIQNEIFYIESYENYTKNKILKE